MTLSWDLVASFLAVVRTGSLSAAARDLGLTQPTVRHQIAALEETLATALFTRSQAGLTPTEAATALVPYAEAMAGSAEALVRAVGDGADEVRGTVRVTASEVLGVEVLPAMLRDVQRAHPHLVIELSATNTNEDLVRRDADVAVRLAQPKQAALVAKRAGTIAIGLFASRSYLATRPAPRSLPDLGKHVLIGRDRDRSFFVALKSAGLALERRDFGFRTDSDVAQLAALRAGVGVGICQVSLARRSPDLVRVLPKVAFALPAWVVTHEDLRHTRRVAVVFEHLVTALADYARV